MIRDQPKTKPAKPKNGVIAVAPPSFRRERALIKRGVWPVAGCDEAGRGPLAGPVVAAAVILDPKRIPKGIDDSKRLTADKREALFEEICATASFAVAYASPARIDRDNILRASLWALARAVQALPQAPRHVLVDGRDKIAASCDCEAVIGGDALVLSIAAASIIAKVARDRLMCRLALDCPGYGFDQHKGYGVPEHLAALDRLGPTIHHRRLFAPVAAAREKHEALALAGDLIKLPRHDPVEISPALG
jgi:ribonuclease HII